MRPREQYNSYMRKYICHRMLQRKLDAIKLKGGKCIRCGYQKCYAAMVFHHRDPNQKEHEWRSLVRTKWETVIAELDKCDLLCFNCHAEIHTQPDAPQRFDEWLSRKKRLKASPKGTCAQCGKQFNIKNKTKYCSRECVRLSQERANWPTDAELIALVKKQGQVKTGKQLGVSPRAVKKRIIRAANSIG